MLNSATDKRRVPQMEPEASTVSQSDEEIMKIVRKLRVGYKLKRTLRYGTTRDFNVHLESVAEHIFSLFFLMEYFLPLEDPAHTLNVERIYRMLLFHDFGEIIHGDIPYHQKTPAHEVREREDARVVFASLPPLMGQAAYVSWQEYELRISPEARFANALD